MRRWWTILHRPIDSWRPWLALAAILGLPLLVAATWPRDDGGTPAAQCAFLNSASQSLACGVANPMPMTTGTSGASATSFGRTWFASGQTGVGAFTAVGTWLSDNEAITYRRDTGATDIRTYRTVNGGLTWANVQQTANPFNNGNSPNQLVVGTGNRHIVGAGCFIAAGACSPIAFTDAFGNGFTLSSFSGIGNGNPGITINTMGKQGSTILAVKTGGSTGTQTCRSTDNGTSFTCAAPGGTFAAGNGMALASPDLSIWLNTSNEVPARLFRSTDDGATWSLVFTYPDAAVTAFTGTLCLTSATCVSTNGTRIVRSVDGGVTWTTQYGPNTNSGWAGFINFGNGVVQAIGNPQIASERWPVSTDFGVTWTPGPTVSAYAGAGANGQVFNAEPRGDGRAIVWVDNSGAGADPARVVEYSPVIPTGAVQIAGSNGQLANVDANGNLGVTFGAGSSVTANQGTAAAAGSGWPVKQDGMAGTNPTTAGWGVMPAQSNGTTNNCSTGNICNTQQTGAANTAVTQTLTQQANSAWRLVRVEARCSAGTSGLTITDGGTTVWSTAATEVGTVNFVRAFDIPLLFVAAAPAVTLATCGVGNAGTLIVHASRF